MEPKKERFKENHRKKAMQKESKWWVKDTKIEIEKIREKNNDANNSQLFYETLAFTNIYMSNRQKVRFSVDNTDQQQRKRSKKNR